MKNVVITGSTRGIGFCMAEEFLKKGCNVTISGRNESTLNDAKNRLSVYSGKILSVVCNVKNKVEVEQLWEHSCQKWGSIDIWINNAGQNCPHEFIVDTEQSYTDAVINTNIKGMIYGSQTAAKNMLAQNKGQIWNMEGLGSNNLIIEKTVLYGMTKHALTYFTKGLAEELKGTHVTVGRLSPGMMLTDFITKDPDGNASDVLHNAGFKKTFNILADKPETVASFFIPKILENTKNNAQIEWLTNGKAAFRFMRAPFSKRKLI